MIAELASKIVFKNKPTAGPIFPLAAIQQPQTMRKEVTI